MLAVAALAFFYFVIFRTSSPKPLSLSKSAAVVQGVIDARRERERAD
jgi:hypothetical protein